MPWKPGEWGIAPCILNLCIRKRWVISSLTQTFDPHNPLDRMLGAPRASQDKGDRGKPLALLTIEFWFLGCPACSLVTLRTELSQNAYKLHNRIMIGLDIYSTLLIQGLFRHDINLYELLQSRNTGKNSINQYKSILYCSYNVFRSSLDHHQGLIHVHHATTTLANV
jgi:hypothetical protein